MRELPQELFTSQGRQEFSRRLGSREIALFLDYDGTLTPIVNDPAAAVLDPAMRKVLSRLAEKFKVALVSGRDLATLKDFVKLDQLYYAGSHGFDISGPGRLQQRNREGEQCRAELEQAEAELREALGPIKGCEIERKTFAIAVHYRNVAAEQIEDIDRKVKATAARFSKLRRGEGKKVFELQPDVDWDKGKAVLWLLQTLDLDQSNVIPLYIGDDLTDEDAFKALADIGIGIYVGTLDRPTAATYRLENVEQVRQFLQTLL